MKLLTKRILHRLGYQISRISNNVPISDPFVEIERLFGHINRPVILDVGAHHGQTAKRFRRIFPKSKIYSFEPFRESFDHLRNNTEDDPDIRVFNFGLGDKNSVLNFHSNPSSETNSLLSTDLRGPETWTHGLLETKEIVEAEFKTLDSVIIEEKIPKVNILKLDVQGAEHLVLKGAVSAFKNGQVDLIYSEIITQPTYVGQKRLDEVLEAYYEYGFDLFNIFNLSVTKNRKLRQLDVIFMKRT